MDIRQIRYFVYAVEGTSLSAAAKCQYVTVQAVSKAISELESELGSRLLIRGNHGVQPTAIGLAFYERVRKMLESFNELEDFTKSFPVAKDSERMIIALCSPAFANAEQFMTTLSKYIGARLGIKLDIIITPGKLAIDALMAGDIDAACTIGEYTSPDTDSVTIGSLPTGIALAKSHPLAHQQSVTLADLRPYPVTWSETYDLFNRSIQAVYRERGLKSPKCVTNPNTFDEQEFFLDRNGYAFAAFLPFSQITQPFIKLLPIDPREAVNIPLCVITPKTRKTDAYLAFERSIESIFRSGKLIPNMH